MNRFLKLVKFLILLCVLSAKVVYAESFLKPVDLGNGIYALIGPIGTRTPENMGLNANYGVIDTPQGAVLIDTGASAQSAAQLAKEVGALTGKPVKWVINTGSQDHRWLGNDYFAREGAEVIALSRTVETQRKLGLAEIDALTRTLGNQMAGTQPAFAKKPIPGTSKKLNLGGRQIEINYYGDAHFPVMQRYFFQKNRSRFQGI